MTYSDLAIKIVHLICRKKGREMKDPRLFYFCAFVIFSHQLQHSAWHPGALECPWVIYVNSESRGAEMKTNVM